MGLDRRKEVGVSVACKRCSGFINHLVYSSSLLCPALCWLGREGKEDPELSLRCSSGLAGSLAGSLMGNGHSVSCDEKVVCPQL